MLDSNLNNWLFGLDISKIDLPSRGLYGIYVFGDYKQRFESRHLRRAQQEFSQELSEGTTLQMLPISSCGRTIGSASKSECCRRGTIALIKRYCWKRISNLGCVTLHSPYLQCDNWRDLFSYLNIESRIIVMSTHEAFYLLHKNVIKNWIIG